jgi:hypothetical protein
MKTLTVQEASRNLSELPQSAAEGLLDCGHGGFGER